MKNILLKSLVAILVYLSITSFSHFDPIKESIDDFAYDTLVANYLHFYEDNFGTLKKEEIPNVNLFVIDDDYLEYNKLENYGYYFPRKEMSSILESLNYILDEMNKPPKAVFIDYDFHYTEMPYGREVSKNDIDLVENILKISKRTAILLPKSKEFHFIEKYLIDNKLDNDNIVFVSANFLLADDLICRRFQSYYTNDEKIYPNVDYSLYLISQNRCNSTKELKNLKEENNQIKICGDTLKSFDVTENRIIPKFFYVYEDNQYNYGFTNWDTNSTKQNIRSVSTLIEESIVPASLEDSIIIIGGDFSGNHDKIAIAQSWAADPVKLPGVVLHLNALNSIYFYDGLLKNLSPILGSLIVFIIFIIFSYFDENKSKLHRFLQFIFNATLMTIVFFLISAIILLKYKLWFNWFAPLFTYQVLKVLYKIKEFTPKVKQIIVKTKN